MDVKQINHVGTEATMVVIWQSCELASLQVEEVIQSLPLVSLSWEVRVAQEQKALPPSSRVAKDDWLCILCGVECVVEVVLERSCLKNVSCFRDCHVYVVHHHSLY